MYKMDKKRKIFRQFRFKISTQKINMHNIKTQKKDVRYTEKKFWKFLEMYQHYISVVLSQKF